MEAASPACPASAPIRLLSDPPQDGATNMAADDTLVDAIGAGHSPPTLRLYRWGPTCLSLGYFQKYADIAAQPLPDSLKCEVARRVTGGGAIIHDQELTYSFCLPANHPLVTRDPRDLYILMHRVGIEAASLLGVVLRFRDDPTAPPASPTPGAFACDQGHVRREDEPFLCFHRLHPVDLVVADLKVMGSAQRRTKAAVLQHGSLITFRRYHQQRCLSLSILAGRIITWDAAAEAFIRAWPMVLPDYPLQAGEWTDAELNARWDAVARHRSAEWVQMR